MNVLKSHLRIAVETLLESGTSQHEIHRHTGVDRKTIRKYARAANSPGVAAGSGGEGAGGGRDGLGLRAAPRLDRGADELGA